MPSMSDLVPENISSQQDRFGRPLADLRISVTDRCNFRCTYCMPREAFGEGFRFLPHREILSFEEISRLARLFHRLGVRKIRLTGGEPLLRRDLWELIRQLAALPATELALTTNGSLLAQQAEALRGAGLDRVSISLDSIRDDTFRRMNDVDLPVATVLRGIAIAADVGLKPIKINTVVRRGVNDGEVLELVEFAREKGYILRLIEYMDVGTLNGWRLDDVVPMAELRRRVESMHELEPLAGDASQVARRFRYADGGGEIGFIASITQPFCAGCSRMRLSADGRLFTCLFAQSGVSLRDPLRSGANDDDLLGTIQSTWRRRTDRYSEERSENTADLQRIEMSYIGG
jgi:cyclic pyranopterin phosphate synthase